MTALGLALLAMAVVLGTSGATKVRARRETEDAFEALRIPFVPRPLGAAVLPWAEIVLALALLVLRGPVLLVAAAAALLLSLAYTWVIARALRFPEPVTCSCFGRFGAARVSTTSLWRNVAMTAVAVLAVVGAAVGQHVWGLVTMSPLWVLVTVLVAALTALVAAGSGHPAASPIASPVASAHGDDEDDALLDYVRQPIPYGQLRAQDGSLATLRGVALTQARLVLFLSGGCAGCRRVTEHIDDWQAQLAPAVGIVPVYFSDPGEVSFTVPWYLDPDRNCATVLEVSWTPTGVLLGMDGLLAGGPVQGEESITGLVSDVLEQLREAAAPDTEPVADPVG